MSRPHLFLPRLETVSQCTNCPYLSSRAEREILRFQLHAKKKISRLGLEMTITTQSLAAEDKGRGLRLSGRTLEASADPAMTNA
jgi:hypothetical protein